MEAQYFEGFLDLMVAISHDMIDWNKSSQKYCLLRTKFLFDNNRAGLYPPENPREEELVALLHPLYHNSSDDIFRSILAYLSPMTVSFCELTHPVFTSLIGKTKSEQMFATDDSCVDVLMANSGFDDSLQDSPNASDSEDDNNSDNTGDKNDSGSKQYDKYLNEDYDGYSYFHHFTILDDAAALGTLLSLKPDGHQDRIQCEFGDGWGELECCGCTPTQIAAANNSTDCLKLLFQAGAKGYASNRAWIGGEGLNVPFVIRKRRNEYWYNGDPSPMQLSMRFGHTESLNLCFDQLIQDSTNAEGGQKEFLTIQLTDMGSGIEECEARSLDIYNKMPCPYDDDVEFAIYPLDHLTPLLYGNIPALLLLFSRFPWLHTVYRPENGSKYEPLDSADGISRSGWFTIVLDTIMHNNQEVCAILLAAAAQYYGKVKNRAALDAFIARYPATLIMEKNADEDVRDDEGDY